MSALACQGRRRFLDRLEDRLHECRQVVRLAAGDQVAVAYHLGIDVAGAGVHDVVLDGEEAGRLDALVGLRRVAELAGIGLAGLGADECDLAAGLTQAVDRIPDLHFLVLLLDEDSGALALEIHRVLLRCGVMLRRRFYEWSWKRRT